MFSVEPLLMDRLAEYVPAGVRVLAIPGLESVAESAQLAPAVLLMYSDYEVVEVGHGGLAHRVATNWLTWVLARNLREITSGAPARADADPIVTAIYRALAGWKPEGLSKPIQLHRAPQAAFAAGSFFLPIGWRLEQVLANPTPI